MNLKVAPAKALLEDLTAILSGDTKKYLDGSPTGNVEMGEQIVGTLQDPIAKALWNMGQKIAADMLDDYKELSDSLDQDDQKAREDVYRTADNAADTARVCSQLFWIRMQMSFPHAHKFGIKLGIRSDWRVVAMKSNSSPFDILRILLNPDRD